MVRESPLESSQPSPKVRSPKNLDLNKDPAKSHAMVSKSKKKIQFKDSTRQLPSDPFKTYGESKKPTSRSPQSSQGRSKTKILNRKLTAIEKNLAEEVATQKRLLLNKQQTTSILKHGQVVDKLIAEKTGTKIEEIGTPDSQDNVQKNAAAGTTGKYIAKIIEQKQKEAESVDLSDQGEVGYSGHKPKELRIVPESTVTSMKSGKKRRKSTRK